MDSNMIKGKLMELAKKVGMSPDTIKAIEGDTMSVSPSPASVTVAVVKKPTTETSTDSEDKIMSDCAALTDDQINKMSEQEAKDYLKKVRDYEKKDMEEDKTEETPSEVKTPSIADRVMGTKTF